MTIEDRLTKREDLIEVRLPGAEKINSIKVSKSNYFNAIQSLCETFECWAEFDIEHWDDGRIKSKTVRFHNYIGKDNHIGFKYGVNLKSISRTIDSK
jgi:phage minor structural protein